MLVKEGQPEYVNPKLVQLKHKWNQGTISQEEKLIFRAEIAAELFERDVIKGIVCNQFALRAFPGSDLESDFTMDVYLQMMNARTVDTIIEKYMEHNLALMNYVGRMVKNHMTNQARSSKGVFYTSVLKKNALAISAGDNRGYTWDEDGEEIEFTQLATEPEYISQDVEDDDDVKQGVQDFDNAEVPVMESKIHLNLYDEEPARDPFYYLNMWDEVQERLTADEVEFMKVKLLRSKNKGEVLSRAEKAMSLQLKTKIAYLHSKCYKVDTSELRAIQLRPILTQSNGEFYMITYAVTQRCKSVVIAGERPGFNQNPVFQYSLQGDFIKEWLTPVQAQQEIGARLEGIRGCISGAILSSKGFIWLRQRSAEKALAVAEEITNRGRKKRSPEKKPRKQSEAVMLRKEATRIRNLAKAESARLDKLVRKQARLRLKLEQAAERKRRTRSIEKVHVHQYTLEGIFIAKHTSTSDAIRATGVDGSTISKVCKYKAISGGGYVWRYSNEVDGTNSITVPTKNVYVRPVDMYTLSNEYVMSFPTVKDAAKHVGASTQHLTAVCKGKSASCHGYIFAYTEFREELSPAA